MATQSRKTGFPEFFADTQSTENLRRQFIEAPMDAAGQAALGTGVELAGLMSILSDAFTASQRREHERVLKSGDEKDPRVAALQTSIDHADLLRSTARRGQVRIQRALVAVASNDEVFHGFVSNTDLVPLGGLTVRVTGSKTGRATALSATTDDDGYFSIALGTKKDTQREPGVTSSPINLSQRIINLMTGRSQEPSASAPASAESGGSQVEILKKGKLLHRDMVPVAPDGGSLYREYLIADAEFSSASDFRNFMSEASKAGADVIRATTPSAIKRSRRGAKSVRSKNKK